MSLSTHIAKVNDELKVTCVVKNKKQITFYINWLRRILNKEVEIGTNGHLNEPFGQTNRYEAKYNLVAPNDVSLVTFELHIKSKLDISQ